MVAVGLLAAIPITIAVRDAGKQPAARTGGAVEGASRSTPASPAANSAPGARHRDRRLRVSYVLPPGWRASRRAGALMLRPADRTVQLVVAAPAAAGEASGVLAQAIAAVKSGYRDVEVRRGSGRAVGGLNARGAVISARGESGGRLRVVLAVASGERRTYLVEVFTTGGASPTRIREAQLALNSLSLRG